MTAVRPWLAPLAPLYRLGSAIHASFKPVRKLRWPVVSIGNLSTGGAGKTPLTISLARALASRGLHVDVLSHGYGRSGRAAMHVDPNGSAEEFGDEPLEITRQAGVPVYVAAQRYEAGLLAEADAQTGIHLLDDGFQHRQLHRDVDILLLNARDLEDDLLPAGNLREPLSAFRRATVLAIAANEPEVEHYLGELEPIDRGTESRRWAEPLWKLHRRMKVPVVEGPVAAFCGIARPEQFFAGLEAAGMKIAARIAFRDHHRYTPSDLARLQKEARAAGASTLITTEKDRIRLEEITATLPIVTAGLRVEIENEDAAMEWLMSRIVEPSSS